MNTFYMGWNNMLDFSPISLGISVFTIIVGFLYYRSRRPHGFPPGPPALPWIGSLPFMSFVDDYLADFMRLRDKYGQIYSIKLGKR